jgi:hypothetical protein
MRHKTSAALTILLMVFGCACFSIAGFNQQIVTGTEALQQQFETFLSGLAECAGTPEAEYARHSAFYAEARGALDRLQAEAELQQGNELTLRSLEDIRDNLAELEELHRSGLSRAELEVISTLFDTQFRMLVELENVKPRKEP